MRICTDESGGVDCRLKKKIEDISTWSRELRDAPTRYQIHPESIAKARADLLGMVDVSLDTI